MRARAIHTGRSWYDWGVWVQECGNNIRSIKTMTLFCLPTSSTSCCLLLVCALTIHRGGYRLYIWHGDCLLFLGLFCVNMMPMIVEKSELGEHCMMNGVTSPAKSCNQQSAAKNSHHEAQLPSQVTTTCFRYQLWAQFIFFSSSFLLFTHCNCRWQLSLSP